MQSNYREFLPAEFDGSSRIWIYQSSRPFTASEALQISEMLHDFVISWNSHGVPVKGFTHLFFEQFILLMVDERASLVSGCSTDSSVRLIKDMENRFRVQLFDRQLLAFIIDGKIRLLPLSQLASVGGNGMIQPETLYFNNTVLTKTELENFWIIPVKDSWLASRISFPLSASL
jgi:hypothetical protein